MMNNACMTRLAHDEIRMRVLCVFDKMTIVLKEIQNLRAFGQGSLTLSVLPMCQFGVLSPHKATFTMLREDWDEMAELRKLM
jgi:hypothetical protein